MQERASILLVDDQKAGLKLLASVLRDQYHIRLANSGAQALAQCQRELPDLVLLDVVMPDMDGFATLEALRSDPKTASVPVIFLTGQHSAEQEQRGLQLGAEDYIHKPYNTDVVLARVNTHIKLIKQRQALEELSLQLDLANQAKSRFLAMISHEIRTPLTSVIGYAEAILAGEIHPTEHQQAISSICQNGKHLLSLLNDVLDLSKIEASKLELETLAVDIVALLLEVADIMAERARRKGLAFEVCYEWPLPQQVLTDPTRLKQILLNLSNNAIKFTQQGFVRLTVGYQHDELRIQVSDSGIGIAPSQQQKLFQAFTQADNSISRSFGGTGLGLIISKQLAERLGGSISLQSEPGVGSVFTVTVHAAMAPDTRMRYEAPEQRQITTTNPVSEQRWQGRVLLAEDQPDNQLLLVRMLQHSGLDVVAVNNGRQLVEAAMSEDFDLILSDIQMPEMDGVSAITLLHAAGNSTPCIALTANTMKHEIDSYIAAGFVDHLAKPIQRQQFAKVLTHYFGQGKAEQLQLPEHEKRLLQQGFLQGLAAQQQLFAQAWQQMDLASLQYQAHALKGTAALFDAPALSQAAGALEQQLRQPNDDHALSHCYQQLMQQLDMIKPLPPSTPWA